MLSFGMSQKKLPVLEQHLCRFASKLFIKFLTAKMKLSGRRTRFIVLLPNSIFLVVNDLYYQISKSMMEKCKLFFCFQGRSAILAEQRNNTFVDVCCASNNRTFSITETNLLLEFRDKKVYYLFFINSHF